MKREPIHENLSTSFVNVEAMVEHLKGLQFVGSIRIELSSYEADIIFAPDGAIHGREHDHFAGFISQGDDALRRIFERSREPLGRITVYRARPTLRAEVPGGVFVDASIAADARRMAHTADSPATHLVPVLAAAEGSADPNGVIADLIETIDASLQVSGLDFRHAFVNACRTFAPIYPFLDPRMNAVQFSGRRIAVVVSGDPVRFAEGLSAVLGELLSRMTGLTNRAETLEALRDNVEIYTRRRWAELDHLGLRWLPGSIFDKI